MQMIKVDTTGDIFRQ